MKKEPAIVLGNAIVWGTVLITTALSLRGTDAYPLIQNILGGGAAASLFITSLCVIKKKDPLASARDVDQPPGS